MDAKTRFLLRQTQRAEQNAPSLTLLPEELIKVPWDSFLGENESRLIEDIFNRRERKILNLAIITARIDEMPPANLTDEEIVFFTKILDIIEKRRDSHVFNVQRKSYFI